MAMMATSPEEIANHEQITEDDTDNQVTTSQNPSDENPAENEKKKPKRNPSLAERIYEHYLDIFRHISRPEEIRVGIVRGWDTSCLWVSSVSRVIEGESISDPRVRLHMNHYLAHADSIQETESESTASLRPEGFIPRSKHDLSDVRIEVEDPRLVRILDQLVMGIRVAATIPILFVVDPNKTSWNSCDTGISERGRILFIGDLNIGIQRTSMANPYGMQVGNGLESYHINSIVQKKHLNNLLDVQSSINMGIQEWVRWTRAIWCVLNHEKGVILADDALRIFKELVIPDVPSLSVIETISKVDGDITNSKYYLSCENHEDITEMMQRILDRIDGDKWPVTRLNQAIIESDIQMAIIYETMQILCGGVIHRDGAGDPIILDNLKIELESLLPLDFAGGNPVREYHLYDKTGSFELIEPKEIFIYDITESCCKGLYESFLRVIPNMTLDEFSNQVSWIAEMHNSTIHTASKRNRRAEWAGIPQNWSGILTDEVIPRRDLIPLLTVKNQEAVRYQLPRMEIPLKSCEGITYEWEDTITMARLHMNPIKEACRTAAARIKESKSLQEITSTLIHARTTITTYIIPTKVIMQESDEKKRIISDEDIDKIAIIQSILPGTVNPEEKKHINATHRIRCALARRIEYDITEADSWNRFLKGYQYRFDRYDQSATI